MSNRWNLAPGWNYSGDMNLTEGGLFWRFDGAERFPDTDYVLAVRVTPCAAAGGPENLFHVETGSIYVPREKYQTALDTCGYTLRENSETGALAIEDSQGAVHRLDSALGAALLVDALNAYGGLDRDYLGGETVIRIGRPDPHFSPDSMREWNPDPDIVLHGNAKLKNHIKREFLS